MKKELSIIVTSYKNPSVLRLCLESLQKNILRENYEILVLDSATEEDTEMMMREDFPKIKFFSHQKNLGFAKLVNNGLKYTSGKFILILNADIIIEKKSVDILLQEFEKNSHLGVIGPKLLNFDGKTQPSCFRFYTLPTIIYRRTFLGKFAFAKRKIDRFLYKDKDLNKPQEVDWLMGSAIMTTRRAVANVGQMEENFGFMYFEDVDWCRRFWEKGYKVIYYPHAKMFHYHGKGSASTSTFRAILFNKLTREHIKSAAKYFWKYLGKPNPHRE
jgi:GT2 family glycosyltransferase